MAISTDLYRGLSNQDQYTCVSAMGQPMNGISDLGRLQQAQMERYRYHEQLKNQPYGKPAPLSDPALLSKVPNLILLCEDI